MANEDDLSRDLLRPEFMSDNTKRMLGLIKDEPMTFDPKRPVGPNLKKLALHQMSIEAVPPGGGLQAAVDFIMSPNGMKDSWVRSLEWAISAIDAVRAAPDNPFGLDEEVIAGEILKRIDERKAAQALARAKVK